MGDKHEERAREIMEFFADYDDLTVRISAALRQSASEAAEKATAAERKRCSFLVLSVFSGNAGTALGEIFAQAIEKEPG